MKYSYIVGTLTTNIETHLEIASCVRTHISRRHINQKKMTLENKWGGKDIHKIDKHETCRICLGNCELLVALVAGICPYIKVILNI